MNELELLIDFHRHGMRQGPGSKADTLRALSFVDLNLTPDSQIADIGCGTGTQTITLARHTRGNIVAVDIFPELLSELDQRIQTIYLKNRIRTLGASMDDLDFEENSLDLIWSEGAIYNMGFEAGVRYWKNFLKPGGYLAVSEVTWITNERPAEIEEFWNREYPEIDRSCQKIYQLEKHGYTLKGYFVLPRSSWWDNYYEPMLDRFGPFLKRHRNSEAAQKLVSGHKEEIRLFQDYGDYYSYGFYIARKNR